MATQHLDLEEQEQIAELKHFWQQWGGLISWALIIVLAGFAAYNGWQYWQRNQAAKAGAIYDVMQQESTKGETLDIKKIEQTLSDIQSNGLGKTTYGAYAGLLAAKVFEQKEDAEKSKAALEWVKANSGDDAIKAIANLRLAAIFAQEKNYEKAMAALSAKAPAEFDAIIADRRGDIYMLENKKQQAAAEYNKAYKIMQDDAVDYKNIIAVKLNSLGIDVSASN